MKGMRRAMMMAMIIGTGLCACHENLDERTERECKEYHKQAFLQEPFCAS